MCTVLLPQPNCSEQIYIYIHTCKQLRGGIAAADCQTVELQVLLSAEITIGIASLSEMLRGKWHLPGRERRTCWPVAHCFKALHIASQQLPTSEQLRIPTESFSLSRHEFHILLQFLEHFDPEFNLTPPVTCSKTTTNPQLHGALLSQ